MLRKSNANSPHLKAILIQGAEKLPKFCKHPLVHMDVHEDHDRKVPIWFIRFVI